MAKNNREPRDNEHEEIDVIVPVDISILGTDDDPCFGKLYDLSTDECQRCGDSEFCALKMGQTMNTKRKLIEESNEFLDITEEPEDTQEEHTKKIRKSIRRAVKKGYSFLKVKKMVAKNYPDYPKESIKEIYNNYKK